MDLKTIQTYDQMAEEYEDETADFWDIIPKTFLDKFSELAKGSVLDVGSGPGRDGLLLKQRGLDITCLDASRSMIKLCLKKGLKAVEGDFNKLPFDGNSFDGVWAYTSLLHVRKSEVEKSIREIARVLKINGTFGLGLIEGETEEYRETYGINRPRWFSFYKKEEIENLLDKNGFEVIYFETFKPKTKNYLNFIARNNKKQKTE